ncbi:MAG: recombinase family protein, partial [Oscillospiraceae bacterium]|nr:recombinase family protein [Oscillospiraceae bacterium]
MSTKRKEPTKEDNRAVVIYARKSVITHKGDSISNQEEYCKEYARLHLQLPADYEFQVYEDEGKSGFYADRPDFQRMIHDVEQKKIRAIVCYKLDRISRKMADLTNLIEYLNKYDVALLISSNNLNTKDSNSKMMIQMLGMIAEFERDVIAERIQDNLVELAKDGRWMGGTTPTGFGTERSKYGSGKKKNAFTYLVAIPEERAMIKHLFATFLKLHSMNATAERLNEEGYRTKNGAPFTLLAVKDILRNPVYCTADKAAYDYFIENDGSVYGDPSEFDGKHGVAVYNRTQQTKEASDDSTFLRPEFTSVRREKDMSDWIIAVGRHEGFISSADWIAAQTLRYEIGDRYNRPHRSTNALLSGLIYCPLCHQRLKVIPESDRYTNGKPRFKYSCPNAVRKGPCGYQAVRGVEMDEFIMDHLTAMSDEDQSFYIGRIQQEIDHLLEVDKSEQEIRAVQKEIEKLERETRTLVKELRTVSENARPYLIADLDQMADRVAEKKRLLLQLENDAADDKTKLKDFAQIKKTILSFRELAETAEPQEIASLISSVIERIYVIGDGKKRECRIFIKGCGVDNYEDFFRPGEDGEEPVVNVCDHMQYRELHPHLCRRPAPQRLRRPHGPPGPPGAHRPGQDHPGLQPALPLLG